MINYDTILSTSEDKLTLMKWLQKVETALKDASLSSVTINQPTAESVILTFHFADGTQLQSPSIALPKGPKGDIGATGATGPQGTGIQTMQVVNGNLMITLTNGQIINAGYIGEGIVVDNALSATSENPVQNKVIAAEIETLHENELPAVQRSFVSNEYEKQLNLINIPKGTLYHTFYEDIPDLKTGVYTLVISGNENLNCELLLNEVSQKVFDSNTPYTFEYTEGSRLKLYVDGTLTSSKVMLNEGPTALPYQPYNGKVVYEKEIEGTLLWENANPNSNFAGQDVTTLDMSAYKYIVLEYKQWVSGNIAISIKVRYETSKEFILMYGASTVDTRLVGIVNSTTVRFGDVNVAEILVPIAIYGTNTL